jgi:methionyl-tRNA formyltransferase
MKISLLSTANASLIGYTIRGLLQAGVQIDSVLFDSKLETAKDHEIHRERTGDGMPPLPLSEFEQAEIPFFFLKNHNSAETAALVKRRGIDILVNAGTPRILKKEILSAPTTGVLNCHPGLLPQFRGCTCVEWAIYLDQPIGNTVHFMNEGIDEGPVVIQEAIAFDPLDDYQAIRTRVYLHGIDLLGRALLRCAEERIHPRNIPPQPEGRYFSVIEPDKMALAVRKVSEGKYRYQRERP